jgi:hypothetical protein
MVPIDFKAAITQDIAEIDLALSVLNGLRNVNMARLAVLHEAEKRSAEIQLHRRGPESWVKLPSHFLFKTDSGTSTVISCCPLTGLAGRTCSNWF